MFEFIRRKVKSPVLLLPIAVIILVFIFMGPNLGSDSRRDAVALVNDQAISSSEFNREYTRTLDRLREQFGGVIPKEIMSGLDIKGQVLQRLTQQLLLIQGGAEMGIHVSDWEVQQNIQQQPPFQVAGAFDRERYNQILASNRLTTKDYEASIRQEMLLGKISKALAGFAQVDDWEVASRNSYNNEKIQIRYAEFSPEQFLGQVQLDDEKLRQWYEKNGSRYQSKAQLKIDFLLFNQADYQAEISPGEAQKYYEANLQQYQVAEQRRASHILLRSSEGERAELLSQINDIRSQAMAGAEFSELAQKFSQDPGSARKGGDLGFFGRGTMVPVFEEAAFAMAPGDISQVVESQFGLHLIKLTEVREATTKPFSEVSAAISQSLATEEAKTMAFSKASEAYEKIFQAGSLASFAAQEKVNLQHSEFFPQSAPPAALTGNRAMLDKVFNLGKGELSSMLESKGGYAIIYVVDRQEPQIPDIAKVKERATADFKTQEALVLADDAAKASLEAIRGGEDFSAVLAEAGVEVKSSSLFSRKQPQAAGLLPGLAEAALELNDKKPLPDSPFTQGNTSVVFSFLSKEQAAAEPDPRLRTALLQEKQMATIEGWLTMQKKKAKVSTNQKFLEQF
ncbi:MAG: SurA N-terminal domain-containing protein [Thermodesulfobacteriota bacterium]